MGQINLRGKRILITGAAHGLGRELVASFLSAGARVLANDLSTERLEELKRDLAKGDRSLLIASGDVCSAQTVDGLEAKVVEEFGGLDILVNNAGVVSGGAFLNVPLSQHHRTIDVNLKAVLSMTHRFLPYLERSQDACLLQIGSVTGLMGLAFGSSYASSKWGVLGLSESLRQELRFLGKSNVHICVVCPSYISTGMFEGSKAPRFMPFLQTKALAQKIVRAVETKRSFVKEPFLVKTVPMLRALLPLRWQDALLDWFGVAHGMKHWRGHSTTAKPKEPVAKSAVNS